MDPNVSISEIMSNKVITVSPEDKLSSVNQIFSAHHFHHIPVVGKGTQLVGLVSKEDLLRLTEVRPEFSDKDFEKIEVKDIMTTNLISLESEDTAGLAADIFLANEFHAIPIVEGKKLVGILTTYDLIKYAFKTPMDKDRDKEFGEVPLDELNSEG